MSQLPNNNIRYTDPYPPKIPHPTPPLDGPFRGSNCRFCHGFGCEKCRNNIRKPPGGFNPVIPM